MIMAWHGDMTDDRIVHVCLSLVYQLISAHGCVAQSLATMEHRKQYIVNYAFTNVGNYLLWAISSNIIFWFGAV